MNWLLFLSQLPANPSSLRVNVWRKLRAAGALGLQNGVWVLPENPDQSKFLTDLLEAIQSQGASGQIFTVTPKDEAIEQDILARFRLDRDEEYAEFLEHSLEFLAEIEKESEKQKFTFAELEENEQDFQRLSNWLEKIQKRDFIGGEKAREAAEELEKCRNVFEIFSAEVYNRQTNETTSDAELADNFKIDTIQEEE
ncbi:MAG: hypothetical protein LLG42_03960 [Chloroflexi bacterium]|nr:hypothetical protein [Chloroflexota bacterium]